MQELTIDPELAAFIPPLTPEERERLTASIVASGGPDEPIDVWRRDDGALVIVDGHNRYAICVAHGLPFRTRSREFADRDAVKAWMFEHQIARRNLSPDQVMMLAALRGIDDGKRGLRARQHADELAAAGRGADVLAGRVSIVAAYNKLLRDTGRAPKRTRRTAPRPPQGPSETPRIPEGHELAGLSTLRGPDGEVKGSWEKTRAAGAEEPPTAIPETFLLKGASVMQRADGSTVVQWSSYEPEKKAQWESIKAAVVEHVQTYVPPAPLVDAPASCDADLLTVYPLGDPHVGMLAWCAEVGESFDLKIGTRELVECMRQMVARAPASERAIVTNLGDFWHAQDDNQRTPRGGNKLDVDGRAGKVGRVGLDLMRTLVDEARAKHARVIVRNVPGNHDPHSALWLPEVLRAWYRDDPRVTIEDAFAPYQFDAFGNVLLGWCHGDGAKLQDLPGIMATDKPDLWGATRFRYWHVGHVHHWSQKELPGCVVETHRTLAGRDAWHHHAGYRSGRALKAITYHREYGLESIAVVGVERVRAALQARAS